MKTKIILLSVIFCAFISCDKKESINDTTCACNIENPQKNIKWLAELIQKAETDQTGNYKGFIWLEKYKGKDIFVVDMALGSGGVAYYFYDCEGNLFVPEHLPFPMKKDNLIYQNIDK